MYSNIPTAYTSGVSLSLGAHQRRRRVRSSTTCGAKSVPPQCSPSGLVPRQNVLKGGSSLQRRFLARISIAGRLGISCSRPGSLHVVKATAWPNDNLPSQSNETDLPMVPESDLSIATLKSAVGRIVSSSLMVAGRAALVLLALLVPAFIASLVPATPAWFLPVLTWSNTITILTCASAVAVAVVGILGILTLSAVQAVRSSFAPTEGYIEEGILASRTSSALTMDPEIPDSGFTSKEDAQKMIADAVEAAKAETLEVAVGKAMEALSEQSAANENAESQAKIDELAAELAKLKFSNREEAQKMVEEAVQAAKAETLEVAVRKAMEALSEQSAANENAESQAKIDELAAELAKLKFSNSQEAEEMRFSSRQEAQEMIDKAIKAAKAETLELAMERVSDLLKDESKFQAESEALNEQLAAELAQASLEQIEGTITAISTSVARRAVEAANLEAEARAASLAEEVAALKAAEVAGEVVTVAQEASKNAAAAAEAVRSMIGALEMTESARVKEAEVGEVKDTEGKDGGKKSDDDNDDDNDEDDDNEKAKQTQGKKGRQEEEEEEGFPVR
eukprot:CAMPEP_0197864892 /NCGR_PEP_ID=MMETSP1438-20131217/43348_1 /TAXON_ID=1461541 /ORGANISM="Pterosperma sp., Strain CCMP1384" /LENGTH=565 /DNA_ID=CAMNT_0043483269 /DNA_START=246 /DNA_END=1940 /DNA_ORIENTATION=-